MIKVASCSRKGCFFDCAGSEEHEGPCRCRRHEREVKQKARRRRWHLKNPCPFTPHQKMCPDCWRDRPVSGRVVKVQARKRR